MGPLLNKPTGAGPDAVSMVFALYGVCGFLGVVIATRIVDTWGPYYVKRIKMVLDGTWQGGQSSWDGLAEGILTMAPYTNMPDDVKKMAQETEAAIRDGKMHVFKCPVTGQDGKAVECKGGAHLSDEQILSMNYFIKGIDDKVPGK